MSTCSICGKKIFEEKSLTLEKFGKKHRFCCTNCLYESNLLYDFKHRKFSSLVLNKTLFEILAIITGLGGVYYTLFEVGSRALIMDTISVATALAALSIGIEHLKYVEEHNLVKRSIDFLSIITINGFALIVWHLGFM